MPSVDLMMLPLLPTATAMLPLVLMAFKFSLVMLVACVHVCASAL